LARLGFVMSGYVGWVLLGQVRSGWYWLGKVISGKDMFYLVR